MNDNPIYKTHYNLLFKNYPQYERLRQELLKLFFRKSLVERGYVDCYVNLNVFLEPLYKRTDYICDEPKSIAASVINFAAHLREFFAGRFSMSCRIFLIMGSNRSDEATRYLPDYDAHNTMDRFSKKEIYMEITDNLNLLSTICPYIPEVYYIENQGFEPAVIIRSIIKEQSAKGAKHARLIFSKDLYDYQLVATVPNTHLIRVKKTMQGDMTYTVSFFDFYKKFNSELKIKTQIGDQVSPELYSMYLTLAGCKTRNIKGIITFPGADTVIKNALNHFKILNGYNSTFAVDPSSLYPFIDSMSYPSDQDIWSILYNRFCAIDLIHQCNLFRIHPSYNSLNNGIVDLYDPEGVKTVNNTYFKKYPLDLNVL